MYTIKIKKASVELMQIILVIIIFISTLIFCCNTERHYTINATITGIEKEMIIFEDKQGYIWRWINYNEDLTEGQSVKLTFFDKGTENDRTDDEIIKFKVVNNNKE